MSVLVSVSARIAGRTVVPTVTQVPGRTMDPEWVRVRALGPGLVEVHTPRMIVSHLVLGRVQVYRLGMVVGRMLGQVVGAHLVVPAMVLLLVAPRRIRIRALVRAPTPMEGQTPVLTRILELVPAQA